MAELYPKPPPPLPTGVPAVPRYMPALACTSEDDPATVNCLIGEVDIPINTFPLASTLTLSVEFVAIPTVFAAGRYSPLVGGIEPVTATPKNDGVSDVVKPVIADCGWLFAASRLASD